MVGDFVLLRSDGMPVYNFCCAVDDHLMQMTHVLRAEEHLPNTLRQLMIYEAMNWQAPQFGHVSLILDDDRQKLSKRKGAVSCGQFKDEGYLPEALLNFIALLGWSHPDEKEVMSLSEMIAGFDTNRLNPSGAVFDRVKLKWMNSMHLRALPNEKLWQLLTPYFARENFDLPGDPHWQSTSLETFKPRMEILSDAIELYRPLNDSSFVVADESEETLKLETTKAVLEAWIQSLKGSGKVSLTEAEFLEIQEKVKNLSGTKGKNLFTPIRVAVIGKPQGTEVKLLIPLMKVQTLIMRAEKVLEKMAQA
jgi:nondiscriminating glutamyl-tRNA synthetase